jgi:hypothetical protein
MKEVDMFFGCFVNVNATGISTALFVADNSADNAIFPNS